MDELRTIWADLLILHRQLKLWKEARESEPMTDDYEIQLDKLTEAIDALDLAENVIVDFMHGVK